MTTPISRSPSPAGWPITRARQPWNMPAGWARGADRARPPPDRVAYHPARQGRYRLLELPQRIMGHARRLQEQAERFHVASHYHQLSGAPPEAQMIDLPP